MKTFALILAATLLTTASAQESPTKGDLDAPANKVKELQLERINTLKRLADTGLKLAQTGRFEIREAAQARMTLLKAELEVAEKDSERIELYTQAVESLKQFEAMAKAAKEAARASEFDRLEIVTRRLEVEIWLEQAKSKAGK